MAKKYEFHTKNEKSYQTGSSAYVQPPTFIRSLTLLATGFLLQGQMFALGGGGGLEGTCLNVLPMIGPGIHWPVIKACKKF